MVLFPSHDKTLALVCWVFSELPPGHQPRSESPTKHKRVETAGQPAPYPEVAQEQGEGLSCCQQFMLFLSATTFAVAPDTYMGSTNCLLPAGTFPRLTSPQHEWLNDPQTVREGVPRRRVVVRQRCSLSLEQVSVNQTTARKRGINYPGRSV